MIKFFAFKENSRPLVGLDLTAPRFHWPGEQKFWSLFFHITFSESNPPPELSFLSLFNFFLFF
jgi:hypothetical protein